MRKVAVFGNAGGGKFTLGRRLAELTGLPLYVVDSEALVLTDVGPPIEPVTNVQVNKEVPWPAARVVG
jgi:adenylate kinase family enzyme